MTEPNANLRPLAVLRVRGLAGLQALPPLRGLVVGHGLRHGSQKFGYVARFTIVG